MWKLGFVLATPVSGCRFNTPPPRVQSEQPRCAFRGSGLSPCCDMLPSCICKASTTGRVNPPSGTCHTWSAAKLWVFVMSANDLYGLQTNSLTTELVKQPDDIRQEPCLCWQTGGHDRPLESESKNNIGLTYILPRVQTVFSLKSWTGWKSTARSKPHRGANILSIVKITGWSQTWLITAALRVL